MHGVVKLYHVKCDRCGYEVEIRHCTYHSVAKEILKPLGWRFSSNEDICPDCAVKAAKGGE